MKIMFIPYLPHDPAESARTAKREAKLNEYASPGTRVDLLSPDHFPGADIVRNASARQVTPGLVHILCTPGIVSKIVWAQENGYDAVVQSNTFDAAVDAARQAVRIPVVGVCRASLHLAATLTNVIGMTVPLQTHIPYAWEIVRRYGMQDFVSDIRSIDVYENAAGRLDDIVARNVEVMRGLVDDTRAGCLIPLGGALVPQLVEPEVIEREVGVPVLNTNAIGIGFAEMCVRLRLSHASRVQPSLPLRYEDFTAALRPS